MNPLGRLLDRLPLLGGIRTEQRRRDATAAAQSRQADQLGQRVDKHAERVLRDYRRYDGAMRGHR